MEFARPIRVPLVPNYVTSPKIRCYELYYSDQKSLVFRLSDDEKNIVGRVTFDELDAIRCCRGEELPFDYPMPDDNDVDFPWVFEVDESKWLEERHAYEMAHYGYPLLNDFVHYAFKFHDEFVEAIARGIWFEKVGCESVDEPADSHPLFDLPIELPAETFSVAGIRCEVRHNPKSNAELLADSQLCTQKLFQYYRWDGGSRIACHAARLRTICGRASTTLGDSKYYCRTPDLITTGGVPSEGEFRPAFSTYVRELAGQ